MTKNDRGGNFSELFSLLCAVVVDWEQYRSYCLLSLPERSTAGTLTMTTRGTDGGLFFSRRNRVESEGPASLNNSHVVSSPSSLICGGLFIRTSNQLMSNGTDEGYSGVMNVREY